MDSILDSIKKLLGITEEYDAFDDQLVIHINSVLMGLTQLGVGPSEGFSIADSDDTWEELLDGKTNLEAVRTYVYLKVRLIFDPPASSTVVGAINNQIAEFEWRFSLNAEKNLEKGGA